MQHHCIYGGFICIMLFTKLNTKYADDWPATLLHGSATYASFYRLEHQGWRSLAATGKIRQRQTTLLHLIAGLLLPTAGEIKIQHTVVSWLKEAQRDRFAGKPFWLGSYMISVQAGQKQVRFLLSTLPINQCYFFGIMVCLLWFS